MQQRVKIPGFTTITPTAPMSADRHGARAKCLQRLIRLDMPVPPTVALSFDEVNAIASGNLPDLGKLVRCAAACGKRSKRDAGQKAAGKGGQHQFVSLVRLATTGLAA